MNHPLSPKQPSGETFTTHITFTSGDTHKEITPEDKIKSTIRRLIGGPAAQMGIIKEVKIVDQMDCIVFLAVADSPLRLPSIKFPPPPAA